MVSISPLGRLGSLPKAGKRCFIGLLDKKDAGDDHVSVARQQSGQPAPGNGEPRISGGFLARPVQ